MLKMFEGTNILEFTKQFHNDSACKQYLADLKWSCGFRCRKCSNTTWCKTKDVNVRKCQKCKHKDSATAGTLFHKCKFPLQKAFMIVFLVSTGKKGISTHELSRKLSLRQKTCWLFKQKIMYAMRSSKQHPLNNHVEVDEFVYGGPEKGKQGRSKSKKKLAVIGIEVDGYGIHRCYAKHIENSGTKQLKVFFEDHISKEANVKTDNWRGYSPLKNQYINLVQEVSDNGKNFPLIHRQIMMFKAWLRGIHHSCKYFQRYLDEYCYRFNRLKFLSTIFHNLIERMINSKSVTYNELKVNWGA